ncbi:MAG: transaldolase [Oscillospiraceae bacterium]
MGKNALKELEGLGQSIWLDYIRRDFVVGGELEKFIEQDGLRGMTSNPAIFEKAILDGVVYEKFMRTMSAAGKDPEAIYEALSQEDVRSAADKFRPVYEKTGGVDGYVSLEVNPHLAHDTEGTIAEARRLWTALDRPNVMIKIPATAEGLPAVRRLIGEGINVNVTLIFGISRYLQVADEYIKGIQDRISRNEPVDHVASVASFFLSRIDTMVDPVFEQIINQDGSLAELAKKAYGQVAVSCAKMAYQNYKRLFEGEIATSMIGRGAKVQRLLWASTSAKNPKFGELKYVEPLIGQNTVNTLPVKTYHAYRDGGNPTLSIENDIAQAEEVLKRLPALGIDMDDVVRRLEDEGIQKFIEPFDKLISTLKNL